MIICVHFYKKTKQNKEIVRTSSRPIAPYKTEYQVESAWYEMCDSGSYVEPDTDSSVLKEDFTLQDFFFFSRGDKCR